KALELAPDLHVVLSEQLPPPCIPELGRLGRRPDDVGEQNGREDAVRLTHRLAPGEEGLHHLEDLVHAPERAGGLTAQLDEPRAGDALRNITPLVHSRVTVAGTVDDECRDADGRKDVSDVDLAVHED